MVGKWSVKNPLTIDERKLLQEGLRLNLSYAQLAQYVGRDKSTLWREAKRLGDVENYTAEKAQEHFERLQQLKNQRITETKLKNSRKKSKTGTPPID